MTDFNEMERRKHIQKLQSANGYLFQPELKNIRIDSRWIGVSLVVGCAIGIIILAGTRACQTRAEQDHPACYSCHDPKKHNQAKMTDYFRKSGNETPEQMAVAVLATKSPRLMAAIATAGEKNSPHTSRNTGYKKQYSGAWQTHRRWGKVTNDVTHQALIAEYALDTHVSEEKNIIAGLNRYGGDKSKKQYAYSVLKELERVP